MGKNKNDNLVVRYDPEADALLMVLKEGREEYFEEVAPGVSVEFDARGKVLGFEILNASRRLKRALPSIEEVLVRPKVVA